MRPPQNKIWGHEWWTFHRPSVTCANALRYSYHLNICSDPKRKQLWISCPRSAWAQTPYVYWKAEIRSAHMHIHIHNCICIHKCIPYSLLAIPYSLGGPPPPCGPGGKGGRGADRLGWGHIRILYKAPKDYPKPQNTIQSPDRPYKAPKRLYKDIRYSTKT